VFQAHGKHVKNAWVSGPDKMLTLWKTKC